jgi:addiction module HigA family antidote
MSAKEIAAHNRGLGKVHAYFIRCRRQQTIGSLAPSERVCKTNQDWQHELSSQMNDFTPESLEHSPVTPGEVLRSKVLGGLKIKQDKLAEALGVSRFTINQVLKGRRRLSAEMALRLSHVLGTSAELWLNLQAKRDLHEAQRDLGEELKILPRLGELAIPDDP